MKQLLFPFLLLSSFVSFSQSQDSVIESANNTHVYWSVGAAGQSFSGIASRIALRPEYEAISKAEMVANLGVTREVGKLMTDYCLTLGSNLRGDKEKKSTALYSFGASLSIGINLLKSYSENHRVKLWPFVGIGIQGFRLTLNKDLSSVPFDSVLQSSSWQQRTTRLRFTNTFLTYRVGLAVDFVEKHNKRSAIGLRAGYIGSFKNNDWRINQEQLLANAPFDRLSRWFAAIQITGIAKKKQKS